MQSREAEMELFKLPSGFGLRQPSGAFGPRPTFESARGLAHSKTLSRLPGRSMKFFASPRSCAFALKLN
jgi:hypothetical protein